MCPNQVWEPQDTYHHGEEQGSSRNSLLAVDNNTSLEREGEKDESGMDMAWGPEMTQQSWSLAAVGSFPPKDKGSDYLGVPAWARPYYPGKDTCPALEILLSPCHLSMCEDLQDSLGNLHFMRDLSAQKNKYNLHRERSKDKCLTDVTIPNFKSGFKMCAAKVAKRSDSHWFM